MTDLLTAAILVYFVAFNGIQLLLNALSTLGLYRVQQRRALDALPHARTALEPPISVLVPACNEEATIAATVRSVLQLGYPAFEIIVINDGSRDRTLAVLQREFALLPFPEAYRIQLPCEPVRAIYRSTLHPYLRVIDKHHGGRADALNAGINASRYPLFCGVGAGAILQRDSLQQLVQPFLRDPRMIATGGTVRAANGCEIKDGHLMRVDLPRSWLARLQVIEHLRAFLFGRLGGSALHAARIVCGAFGLFKKEAVIEAGGYRRDTLGADMELVVRLRRRLRRQRQPCRIEFVPDPVCWTEVPEDLRTLRQQRVRWQRGLRDSLRSHWPLMGGRRGGWPAWAAYAYLLLFEWLGPAFEVGGYLWFLCAFAAGLIAWQAFAVFLFLALGMGILLSASGLLLEEAAVALYPRKRHLAILALLVVLENLGYRQLNACWRLQGLLPWQRQQDQPRGTLQHGDKRHDGR